MVYRRILVPLLPREDPTRRAAAALKLCRRLGAHIDLLYIRHDPARAFRSLPDVVVATGVTLGEIEREEDSFAAEARQTFRRFCTAESIAVDALPEGLGTTFGHFMEQTGDIEHVLSLAGRLSDLIVVEVPSLTRPATERLFDTAVFSCGRPTLVLPAQTPDDPLRHVAIAWNGSLEVSRLIGHALPLLHAADHVSIITAPVPDLPYGLVDALKDYLVWHGIRARILPSLDPDGATGEEILAAAQQAEATMLLMGAYTHSRVRQFLLGGVTRHMLQHATMPVLMEH